MGDAAGAGPDSGGVSGWGLRDGVAGAVAAAVLVAAIWAGSLGFRYFDSALIGYAVAITALTFAIVARYARWLRMPSTRRYWRRGWQLFASVENFRQLPDLLPRAIGGQLLGQGFIRRRGVVRWIGHQCLFWGVMGATHRLRRRSRRARRLLPPTRDGRGLRSDRLVRDRPAVALPHRPRRHGIRPPAVRGGPELRRMTDAAGRGVRARARRVGPRAPTVPPRRAVARGTTRMWHGRRA